jgi:hypothetical protein
MIPFDFVRIHDMGEHEGFLQHHAFHIALTVTALAVVGAWWLLQKRSRK